MINNVGFSYNRAGFKATYPEKLPEKLQKAIKDIPQDKFDAAIEKVSYIDRGTGERKFDISGFKKAADTYSISSDERNIYDLAGDVVSYVQVQRYEAKKRR